VKNRIGATIDAQVKAKFASAGNVKIVSKYYSLSFHAKKLFRFSLNSVGGAELIQYDPISNYGIKKAAETYYGTAVIPSYSFDKAKTIVSFGADFLGTWISPIEFAGQYAKDS